MFHDLVADPADLTPEEVYDRYVDELAAVVEEHGIETVVERSRLDAGTVEALRGDEEPQGREEPRGREAPEVTLEEAAAVLAVRPDAPAADAIAAASRDALLMGMSAAVLDVEALSAEVGRELEPREIQSKIEGRFPMTLREFALLHRFVSERRIDRG